MPIRAVIFDLGGVVFESPLDLIRQYESSLGHPEHFVARLVGGYGGEGGAWQRLERGELPIGDFCDELDGLARELGEAFSSRDLIRPADSTWCPFPVC